MKEQRWDGYLRTSQHETALVQFGHSHEKGNHRKPKSFQAIL